MRNVIHLLTRNKLISLPGNVKFRNLVNAHKMRYLAASKSEKPLVAREVVHLWRNMTPPGRYLEKIGESWNEVGDQRAREKTSQCLRERTPDVLHHYIRRRELKNEKARMMENEARASWACISGATAPSQLTRSSSSASLASVQV